MSRVNLSSPILTTLFCCGCPLYFNVSIPLPRRYIVGYYNVKQSRSYLPRFFMILSNEWAWLRKLSIYPMASPRTSQLFFNRWIPQLLLSRASLRIFIIFHLIVYVFLSFSLILMLLVIYKILRYYLITR